MDVGDVLDWYDARPTGPGTIPSTIMEEHLAEALRTERAEAAEKIRAAKEAAWDEGRQMGGRSPFFQEPNPYRRPKETDLAAQQHMAYGDLAPLPVEATPEQMQDIADRFRAQYPDITKWLEIH